MKGLTLGGLIAGVIILMSAGIALPEDRKSSPDGSDASNSDSKTKGDPQRSDSDSNRPPSSPTGPKIQLPKAPKPNPSIPKNVFEPNQDLYKDGGALTGSKGLEGG